MLKALKYGMLMIAATILLLHNIIPHSHKSELTKGEHVKVHAVLDFNSFDYLTLVFHEFTEEGQMEDFQLDTNTITFNHANQGILLFLFAQFGETAIVESAEVSLHFIASFGPNTAAGFLGECSVRPPPFA